MPGIRHEMPLEFIRNRPMTAVELLRDAAGVPPPPFATATVEEVDCTQLTPVEFRADSVVVLRDEAGRPRMALIVEVQNRHDTRKRYSWPVYATALRARLGCPTTLMVICPDQAMARWCRQSIVLGPSGVVTPVAIHPGHVPMITDVERARECPELAVLSAVAHGERPEGSEALAAMLAALETLDADQAKLYLNYVFTALPSVARKHLEGIVTTLAEYYENQAQQYLSHWVDRGREQGREEGEARGEAKMLLAVLHGRGLDISPEVRERITGCSDVNLLEAWGRRAAVVASAEDLFT
ncbi:hypothetical protein [Microbispora sp. NPDC049125]|uniref:hypothetical protein n=1 Tax=Microbispora sp. NPDC049125 TaxID=3154929 RepID=UPI003466A5D7